MKSKFYLLLMLLWAMSCRENPQTLVLDKPTTGVLAKNGMVVSAHPLATQVGLDVLKEGGNAFDAAIAVQYALAVVLPKAGNIGGGGFMVYRKADGETGALDFREKAPGNADKDMYLDGEGNPISSLSKRGHLAAGVPGTVAGMDEAYKKFGSLPFERLIQPSIDLAGNGFELTEYEASLLARFQEVFKEVNGDIYLVSDEPFEAGDTIYHKDLSKTLSLIRDQGRDGFYKGETAKLVELEMEKGGGIITQEDMANYQAAWRKPIEVTYKDSFNIISMPPSSSGGVALAQLMLGSANYDFKSTGLNTAKSIHLMTELQRRVYADRATHLGDMDFYDVPLEMLLDADYLADRYSSIAMDSATNSQAIKAGEVATIESFETTHFSIVDKEGNAVAITTTLNGYFGCKVLVEGAGFFLNNEMDDFSVKPGVPNQFGLVGAEANSIQPGKRMLSSMTPTIIEKNDKLLMVVGTPGGSTIITNVYQVIMNVLEHGLTMQEAVNAKKMHSQWLPDQVIVEQGLDSLMLDTLRSMGHSIREIEQIGRIEAVLVTEDGMLEGAADNTRTGDATAMGY